MTVHHDDFIPCDGMDYSDIALVEPLSVGRHAANRVPAVAGKLVLLYGLGIIGVGILIELKRLGAKVIVADVAADKLDLALRLGADYALDIKDAEFDSTIDKLSGGMGLDIVFDAVGSAKIVESALSRTAVAATIVFVGYHTDTIPFNTKPIVSKELSVYGSRNALKADFEGSRDNLRSNPALKELLVTNRFAFSELAEAFRYWSENRGSVMKILVDMPEGERK
jgi:threonine dehydrogenase-like Zn-dependent dehydrogenase